MKNTIQRLAVVIAATILTIATGQSAAAETRVLLVGVWKFDSPLLKDLIGPENDLRAMEDVVRTQGATDVTVLRNEQVSRTTVETALHALGLRAKPGDWIMIYYSGHGAEADAARRGTRDGERDQFLPLARFDPADPERYIVDKDFYNWMSRYVPATTQILFMADACHSGTLNRSVDKRSFGFTSRLGIRAADADFTLGARPAPRFPAVLGGAEAVVDTTERADLPNVVYIAASRDDQLAWEYPLPMEGAPKRGLLTYNFEQGLTTADVTGTSLAADLDANGAVEMGELAQYLATQVRAYTDDRQEPQAWMAAGADRMKLFARFDSSVAAPAAPGLPAIYAAAPAARPLLAASGAPWRVATSAATADFVWDFAAGALVRRSGDQVAQDVTTTAQLRGVLEKWDTIAQLRPFLDESRLRLTVGPAAPGARYAPDAKVDVAVTAGKGAAGKDTAGRDAADKDTAPQFLTVFNVAADGNVQSLFPAASEGEGAIARGQSVPLIESHVVTPYGTDHVVALLTPQPPLALRALLRGIEGQRASGRLVTPLRQALAAAGAAGGLSIGELRTGR